MIVLALLVSDRQVRQVISATSSPHRVLSVRSARDASALLRTQPADVLVIDPVVGDTVPRVAASPTELFAIASEFPYVPVVFYVSNAVKALPLVARFPTRERCEALIAGIDDSLDAIRSAIDSVVSSSLVAELVRQLLPTLPGEATALVRAISRLLSNPKLYRTAEDVALVACMSRRSLDRTLQNHGLVSGSRLLHTARAFVALREARDDLLVVGEARGSRKIRPASRAKRGITRVAGIPKEVIVQWTTDELIAWVCDLATARLRPSAGQEASANSDLVQSDASRQPQALKY
jgi:hypothetical protein